MLILFLTLSQITAVMKLKNKLEETSHTNYYDYKSNGKCKYFIMGLSDIRFFFLEASFLKANDWDFQLLLKQKKNLPKVLSKRNLKVRHSFTLVSQKMRDESMQIYS